ncbi:hypothetical protein, partial [Pseudonocardia sp. Ae706_Ps2]|uniref:hypothetical protein n=2 Tax=Pseudonocardia TaxID=1847 RepID=UPI001C3776FC
MLDPSPADPDPARQWMPPGLVPTRPVRRAGRGGVDVEENWLRDKILAATRELVCAAEKVRNPYGATLEDQAPAAWHVRTTQAILDDCVEHLDDLDDRDGRHGPGGPPQRSTR